MPHITIHIFRCVYTHQCHRYHQWEFVHSHLSQVTDYTKHVYSITIHVLYLWVVQYWHTVDLKTAVNKRSSPHSCIINVHVHVYMSISHLLYHLVIRHSNRCLIDSCWLIKLYIIGFTASGSRTIKFLIIASKHCLRRPTSLIAWC